MSDEQLREFFLSRVAFLTERLLEFLYELLDVRRFSGLGVVSLRVIHRRDLGADGRGLVVRIVIISLLVILGFFFGLVLVLVFVLTEAPPLNNRVLKETLELLTYIVRDELGLTLKR